MFRHSVLQLNYSLVEALGLDFVREKEFAFLWSLGCINVVFAEVENFVVDVHHQLLERTFSTLVIILDIIQGSLRSL